MAFVIQSWIDIPDPMKTLSTNTKRYFILENEEDKKFITNAVMRVLTRYAWDGSLYLQRAASSESAANFSAMEALGMSRINQIEFLGDLQESNLCLGGEVLSAFVNKKTADNSLKMISPSQFDDILLERGHAFKPTPHSPWPPAMFDQVVDLVPDQILDNKLDETPERTTGNNEWEVYGFIIRDRYYPKVLYGDLAISIRT